jgi:DNA-directed RNA polymerase subunit RPC12/RpoP
MRKEMRCADCNEDILHKNPERCPYCGSTNLISDEEYKQKTLVEIETLKKEGKFEEAVLKYEELEMWEAADECRKITKNGQVSSTDSDVGKISAILMECPRCGTSQQVSSKTREVTCKNCGKKYILPKKALDLF